MRDQQQLVVIEHHLKKVNEKDDVGFDYPMFLDARKHLTTIEGISGSQDTTMMHHWRRKAGSISRRGNPGGRLSNARCNTAAWTLVSFGRK